MSRDIEIKQHILNMLKDVMMGESGSKFKPKAIEVEVISAPKSKEGLADVLKEASEANPVEEEGAADKYADKINAADAGESEEEWEDSPEDEEADEKNRGMTLSQFLASKSK